jgi:hypothetical protein
MITRDDKDLSALPPKTGWPCRPIARFCRPFDENDLISFVEKQVMSK